MKKDSYYEQKRPMTLGELWGHIVEYPDYLKIKTAGDDDYEQTIFTDVMDEIVKEWFNRKVADWSAGADRIYFYLAVTLAKESEDE